LPYAGKAIALIWENKWKILTLNFQWSSNLNLFQNIFRNTILPNSRGRRSMHVQFSVWIMSVLTFMSVMEGFGRMFSTQAWIVWGGLTIIVLALFGLSEYQKRNIGNGVEQEQ